MGGAVSAHLAPAHRGPQLRLFQVSNRFCLPALLMTVQHVPRDARWIGPAAFPPKSSSGRILPACLLHARHGARC